jgi:hypothetical protein
VAADNLSNGVGAQWKLGRVLPFGLNTVDQVCPGNFDGFYKAPAVDLVNGVYMVVQKDDEWLAESGFLGFQRGFVLKNPTPEILVGHRLQRITGVFGVLFQLLGNFLK